MRSLNASPRVDREFSSPILSKRETDNETSVQHQTLVGSSRHRPLMSGRTAPGQDRRTAPKLKLSVNVPEQSAQLFTDVHAHCSQLWPRVWK